MTEAQIQAAIMLAVGGREDTRVFRNNAGVAHYPDGSVVRYGVGNPGGSDLIGIQAVTITPAMVGQVIGRFVALEVKANGRATQEQRAFIAMVLRFGGVAGVVRSPEEAVAVLEASR
ncbi:VRR-NUC domain-containing protein [Roseomonas sp. NAR14]|uniref:VRR-NUC domain-containing protein n=1 Tax=Roseomonas acroporae TaxID=2937791 RepID=A0A9X1Y763_9PROT|nr:VRR-NUC domain-containing protein [Roseomonas acroporae]MCK8785229.1 VRR-NUC domain-containing protein [Roseomonas acroporae]